MINEYAVEEFIQNCKSRDVIKARLVLDYFYELQPREQRRILLEITKSEDDFGLPLLVYLAVKHPVAATEFQTLTETITDKAQNHPELVIYNIGKVLPEQDYYIALAKSLGFRGSIIDQLKNTKADSVMAVLAESMGSEELHDRLTLDVFASSGTDFTIQELIKTLVSENALIRNHGKLRLKQMGAVAVPYIVLHISAHDTDLQIHVLNLLQEIGDKSSVSEIRKLINSHPADANVRFAAYEALAGLPFPKGDYVLASGLTDADDGVRLAAARAIDRHFDPVFLKGINNLIEYHDEDAEKIVKAIFAAQTRDLFLNLLDNDFFQKMISEVLAVKSHADVRDYHVQMLKENQQPELAQHILTLAAGVSVVKDKVKVCAVDDSKMILSLYRQMLNELGVEPVIFEFPKEFFKWLKTEKPDLVFTDLNMPEITGIDLINQVRERFNKDDLPVVMVTTQSQGEDKEMAMNVGANAVISKPFNREKLKAVLDSYLN